jgi:hypothetical protein
MKCIGCLLLQYTIVNRLTNSTRRQSILQQNSYIIVSLMKMVDCKCLQLKKKFKSNHLTKA